MLSFISIILIAVLVGMKKEVLNNEKVKNSQTVSQHDVLLKFNPVKIYILADTQPYHIFSLEIHSTLS